MAKKSKQRYCSPERYEEIRVIASRYTKKGMFRLENPALYNLCVDAGLVRDETLFGHMENKYPAREFLTDDQIVESVIESAKGYSFRKEWKRDNPKLARRVQRKGLAKDPRIRALFVRYDARAKKRGMSDEEAAKAEIRRNNASVAEKQERDRREQKRREKLPVMRKHQARNFQLILQETASEYDTLEQFETKHPVLFRKAKGADLLEDHEIFGNTAANTRLAMKSRRSMGEIVKAAAGFDTIKAWFDGDRKTFDSALRQGVLIDPDVVSHMENIKKDLTKLLTPVFLDHARKHESFAQWRNCNPNTLKIVENLGLQNKDAILARLTAESRPDTLPEVTESWPKPLPDEISHKIAEAIASGQEGLLSANMHGHIEDLDSIEGILGDYSEIEDPFDVASSVDNRF